jgi:hypothetical protein
VADDAASLDIILTLDLRDPSISIKKVTVYEWNCATCKKLGKHSTSASPPTSRSRLRPLLI